MNTCKEFDPLVSNKALIQEALTTRNNVMHDAHLKVTQDGLWKHFNTLIKLITDAKLKGDRDMNPNGVNQLVMIRDSGYTLSVQQEQRVWRSRLSQISQGLDALAQQQMDSEIVAYLNDHPDLLESLVKSDADTKKQFVSLEARVKNTETQTARLDTRVDKLELSTNAAVVTLKRRVTTVEEELESCKLKKPDSEAVLQDLRTDLAATYRRECSRIQPISWIKKTMALKDVLVPVALKRSTKDEFGPEKKDDRSIGLEDILTPAKADSEPPKKVLIEGAAGMGKSILSLCLGLLWADDVQSSPQPASSTSTPTQPPPGHSQASGGVRPRVSNVRQEVGITRINAFTIVVLLMVRKLIVGDLSDNLLLLLTADWRSRKDEIASCLEQNCQKVCIILDGFDEASDDQQELIHRILDDQLRGSTIVVTSRPGFCNSTFEASYILQGFDSPKQKCYVEKFMLATMGVPNHPLQKSLLQQFSCPGVLVDLCHNPLFLALVCILGSQQKNPLPVGRTALYEQFDKLIHRQAAKQHGFKPDKISALQQILQPVAFALTRDNTSEIHLTLIDLHSTAQPSTPHSPVRPHDLSPAEPQSILDDLCHVGFVTQEQHLQGLDEVTSGYFIHQSFTEYFSAKYLTNNDEQRANFIEQNVAQKTIFHNVFGYIAGLAAKPELFSELLDAWWRAMADHDTPNFQSSDLAKEMETMSSLTFKNHALFHAPLEWLDESSDVCSASHTFLMKTEIKAICLTQICTAACVRGIEKLIKVCSDLQDPPARQPLHLGLWRCDLLQVRHVLTTLQHIVKTRGAVNCVALRLGSEFTMGDCEQMAAILPKLTGLREIVTFVERWSALDALSRGFTSTAQLQRLTVMCHHGDNTFERQRVSMFQPQLRPTAQLQQFPGMCYHGDSTSEPQGFSMFQPPLLPTGSVWNALPEFTSNIDKLANIEMIKLTDWTNKTLNEEVKIKLRAWGKAHGVNVCV